MFENCPSERLPFFVKIAAWQKIVGRKGLGQEGDRGAAAFGSNAVVTIRLAVERSRYPLFHRGGGQELEFAVLDGLDEGDILVSIPGLIEGDASGDPVDLDSL